LDDELKELLSLVEEDTQWLDDAAQHFEDVAGTVANCERPNWQLLAAVYHERADNHRNLLAKTHPR
jgi:hypothetical protein